MTPERLKCAVREAPQRRLLLYNGSLGTFPQQRMGFGNQSVCYEINTRCGSTRWARDNRGTVGGGDLYTVRPEVIKEGHIINSLFNFYSSFVLNDS
jgi:hypothetical protein